VAETSRDRMVRMLGMVAYLEANGPTPVKTLAAHFGVTERRARDELWTLGTSGVPPYLPDECLDFDFDALDEGLAILRDSQGVSQVRLSGQEAIALTGALGTMLDAGTAPAGAEQVLARIREAGGDVAPVTVLEGAEHVGGDIRTALTTAIDDGVAAAIGYVDAQDRRTDRIIEPHRLVAIDGVGYVECWCRKAQDYRTLRLSRIESAAVLDSSQSHGPSEEPGFALEAQYHATVVVARGARWAFEDIGSATITVDDVNATVELGVTDEDWAAARLLSVAPALVSVEPARLREVLRRHADAVLAAQGD